MKLVSLTSVFALLLAPVVWGQTDPPIPNVIDSVEIRYSSDDPSIIFTFSSIYDNPFDYEYYYTYYERGYVGVSDDILNCIANKFVFVNEDRTTFTPQYRGRCHSPSTTTLNIELDNRDFLEFIKLGFADLNRDLGQYPNLTVYTLDSISEGEFPIQPIPPEESLVVTYRWYDYGFKLSDIEYFVGDGILLTHFRFFVRLSELNLEGLRVASVEYLNLNANNSRNLTGATILTVPDEDLIINVAIQLSTEDRIFLIDNDICVNWSNCFIMWNRSFSTSFNGYQTNDNKYGYRIRKIWPETSDTREAYLVLDVNFIGYSIEFVLPNGYPYSPRATNGFVDHVTSVTCITAGGKYINPELYLNGEAIDERYLTRSWPTEITLTADDGILNEKLLGYFSCRTANDSFVTGSVLHNDYNYVALTEGSVFNVDCGDSLVVRFAHNNFYTSIGSIQNKFGIRTRLNNIPPFSYSIVPGDIPYTGEIHINVTQYSYAGKYEVYTLYGNRKRFSFTINITPTLKIIPAVIAVLPGDTSVVLECQSNAAIETAWVLPGDKNITDNENLWEGSTPEIVDSSTYIYNLTNKNLEELDGEEVWCVFIDPDNPENIVSEAITEFRLVEDALTLVTEDENGIRQMQNDKGVTSDTYFECIGHTGSGEVGLYWSIIDRERKRTIIFEEDFVNDTFIASVRDNFLTLSILGAFFGEVSCKSGVSTNEIAVNVLSSVVFMFTTPPPAVIPPGAEYHTLIIELEGYTTQTFTTEVQSTFKQITANSINSYCEDNVCEIVFLAENSNPRKKRAGHSFDADDFVITNIQAVDDDSIQFYMYADHDGVLEGGALLNAVLGNIDEYSNSGFFLASVDRLATPSPSSVTILMLEQITGIAVGGGVFVVIVIIALVSLCACCCIRYLKKKGVKNYQDFAGGHVENPVYMNSEPTPEGDGEKAKEALDEEDKADLTSPETA